jgi:hypothetical protein
MQGASSCAGVAHWLDLPVFAVTGVARHPTHHRRCNDVAVRSTEDGTRLPSASPATSVPRGFKSCCRHAE